MTAWLDVLRAAVPPRGVLLVGAGAGNGPWVQWLQSRGVASAAVPVHLVEGDERQYRRLHREAEPSQASFTLWRDVVAPRSGSATFYSSSNPAESGLLPVPSLQQLWPHLAVARVSAIEDATTLDALHAEAGECINWLILDCLPAAALLQGGPKLLTQLDVALVRTASDLPSELLAGEDPITDLMYAAGLRPVHTQTERHPALAHVLYLRDTSVQIKAFQETLSETRAQTESVCSQFRASREFWAKKEKELTLSQQATDQAKERALQQAGQLQEELRRAHAQLNQARDEARATSDQLKSAQENWAKEREQLLAQIQQATNLGPEQAQLLAGKLEKHLRTSIGKDLSNAVKQIEAFLSIQNYLSTGESISGFHGWPISPDIGLFLIERIRERQYDLIIEFGSGTSTALFAKAVQVSRRTNASVRPTAGDLGKSVHSFEHDSKYLLKTRALLEAQGLGDDVGLNHAPLVDWQDDTGRYLYYDCDEALVALANRLTGNPKRVLVLVDGPPGSTCANARYPAVPHVFKHLARHELDLVLDDANRPEEKAVIELWRAFWKQRSMRVTEGTVTSEKGLYWASTYDRQP